MHIDEIIHHCASLKAATDHFPFDNRTLVFKVQGKMFALMDIENPETINLKCDPEKAIELRERYDGIQPGYHMNKKHWNSVYLNGSVDDNLIKELIVNSYDLVVKSLPKKLRYELEVG
jgi:predicted DNA-binding protein (MmcQ/YjbR family)